MKDNYTYFGNLVSNILSEFKMRDIRKVRQNFRIKIYKGLIDNFDRGEFIENHLMDNKVICHFDDLKNGTDAYFSFVAPDDYENGLFILKWMHERYANMFDKIIPMPGKKLILRFKTK